MATLEEVARKLDLHIAREGSMLTKVEAVFKAVVTGNGEPPIKETLHAHSRWIDNANRVLWLIVGATVTALVGAIGSLIILVTRIYPLLEKLHELELIR